MQINGDNAIEILNSFLRKLIEKEGTDLHVKSDSIIRARLKGAMTPLSLDKLDHKHVKAIVTFFDG